MEEQACGEGSYREMNPNTHSSFSPMWQGAGWALRPPDSSFAEGVQGTGPCKRRPLTP